MSVNQPKNPTVQWAGGWQIGFLKIMPPQFQRLNLTMITSTIGLTKLNMALSKLMRTNLFSGELKIFF